MKITKEQEKNICELYISGWSANSIGQNIGISNSSVFRVLKRNGVGSRTRSEAQKNKSLSLEKYRDFVVDAYTKQKKSAYDLANTLGVNIKTVYRFLRANNIAIRDNKKAHDYLYENNTKLSDDKIEKINGWLLGDGSIQDCKTQQSSFTQTTIHLEYAKYIQSVLKDIGAKIIEDRRAKYKNKAYIVYTSRTRQLRKIWDKWYCNGKKIIPYDLEVSPSLMANWIMDDGSLDINHGTLHIYTCAFSVDDISRMISKMKDITDGHISVCSKKMYPYLYLSRKAAKDMLDYSGSPPVKCFDYKWLGGGAPC